MKGFRGMFFGEDSKYSEKLPNNIPPAPFKGGEIPCKSPDFEQKINVKKFAKQNLTALPSKGELHCANSNLRKKFSHFTSCETELNSPVMKWGRARNVIQVDKFSIV